MSRYDLQVNACRGPTAHRISAFYKHFLCRCFYRYGLWRTCSRQQGFGVIGREVSYFDLRTRSSGLVGQTGYIVIRSTSSAGRAFPAPDAVAFTDVVRMGVSGRRVAPSSIGVPVADLDGPVSVIAVFMP